MTRWSDEYETEAEFWRRRYDEQHDTLHRMEDTLADLRDAAQAVLDTLDRSGSFNDEQVEHLRALVGR